MPNELPNRNHLKRIPVWIPDNQSVIYFVTVCCADRRKIFTNDQPIKIAIESLIKCTAATQWNIPQICIMPDHIHLMMCPALNRDQKLSKIIQRWKSSSKQRLNHAGIKGDIWQHEFFDRLLRSSESLTDKWRYVEMNPVRAGLSSTPEEYPYLGTPEQILARIENCREGTVEERDLPATDSYQYLTIR